MSTFFQQNPPLAFGRAMLLKSETHYILIFLVSEMDFSEFPYNQRTNGPVNAHLISGPSAKTSFAKFDIIVKIGQGKHRVIIYIRDVNRSPDIQTLASHSEVRMHFLHPDVRINLSKM